MRVLIADDVGFIRRRVQVFLAEHGYDVLMAKCGQSALELLKKDNTIEAVITDLYMPQLNGLELFAAAKQIERISDSQKSVRPPGFILMTATSPDAPAPGRREHLGQYATDMGFLAVLPKPMDHERLLCLLEVIGNESADSYRCPVGNKPPPSVPQQVSQALKLIQEAINNMIGTADIDAMLKLHDELTGQVGRLHSSLEMFTVDSGLDADDSGMSPEMHSEEKAQPTLLCG